MISRWQNIRFKLGWKLMGAWQNDKPFHEGHWRYRVYKLGARITP